jgi:hypothetical protein
MAQQQQPQRRELVRRPTTMAAAFAVALEKQGYDTSNARMPLKREPSWRVTRKA